MSRNWRHVQDLLLPHLRCCASSRSCPDWAVKSRRALPEILIQIWVNEPGESLIAPSEVLAVGDDPVQLCDLVNNPDTLQQHRETWCYVLLVNIRLPGNPRGVRGARPTVAQHQR
eukprot:540507-Hanusia_phi.AAC.6